MLFRSLLTLAILWGVLSSCAPPGGLILTDRALAVLDPEGAKAYASFRAAGTRWEAREYPVPDADAFVLEFASRPPAFVLLSPLLASEYPSLRGVFPDAIFLGTGIPASGRSISAAWDPVPAAREAGVRAGAFLRDRGEGLSEPPEAVILVAGGVGGGGRAAEAFREGLASVLPDTPVRALELPGQPADADALVRSLEGPAARAVFLDAGAAGFRAGRNLAAAAGAARGPRFIILRTALPPASEVPADILLLRKPRTLLRAFRKALREGKTGSIVVPESTEIRSGGG